MNRILQIYLVNTMPMQLHVSAYEASNLFNRFCKHEFSHSDMCRGNTAEGGEFVFAWADVRSMLIIPVPQVTQAVQQPQVIMGQQKPVMQFGNIIDDRLRSTVSGSLVSGAVIPIR